MGKLTRDQIITQGMKLAGKSTDALAAIVQTSFNAWLRSTYQGWLWPFLNLQATGVALSAGATSLLIGGGSGGISNDIDEPFDPIYVYTTDYTTRGVARLRQVRGGSAETEPSVLNSSTVRGMPTQFKAVPGAGATEGKWTLIPYPFPDRSYLLSIDYKLAPADLSSGSEVPLYKNDRTLIQAAKVCTLEHMNGQEGIGPELDLLAAMVAQDFGKSGRAPGANDKTELDSKVFR